MGAFQQCILFYASFQYGYTRMKISVSLAKTLYTRANNQHVLLTKV